MVKQIVFLFFIIFTFQFNGLAQETETWYLWIDTKVDIDGKETRIVSKEPFEITCCLKSPKYRKLLKQTRQWIKKNHGNFEGEAIQKIQDISFAQTMIKNAVEEKGNGGNIKLIDYTAVCRE